jgi:hypothetical protein
MKKFIPTEEELKNILRMYNEELLGSHTISEKTGVSKPTILRVLKENGVVMGSSGRRNIGGRKVAIKKYESKPETKERRKKNYDKWYEQNKENRKEYHKKWRIENVDKWRQIKRDYEKNRKSNDPLYKLISNFRTAIYQVLKENNVKKNGHYFDILKYTPQQLIEHLEKQFSDEMTWDNYGLWHVDHKHPISLYNIEKIGDDEFLKCWSLDNLQPMWGSENIKKSNKLF